MEDVDRPLAGAELRETVRDGVARGGGAEGCGGQQILAAGQERGDRGGVRAPGAVRRGDILSSNGDLELRGAVEVMVGVAATGDDRGRCTELDDAPRLF